MIYNNSNQFTIIPNLNQVIKKKYFSLYSTICYFIWNNDNVEKSLKELEDFTWITKATIIKHLKQMQDDWILMIQNQKNKDWTDTKNKYSIVISENETVELKDIKKEIQKKKETNNETPDEKIIKIKNILETTDNENCKMSLNMFNILKYMIQLWYKFDVNEWSIIDYVRWCKDSIMKFVWTSPIDGRPLYDKAEKIAFNWLSYHSEKWTKITIYRNSLITFFKNDAKFNK